jgi:hypothetical protein
LVSLRGGIRCDNDGGWRINRHRKTKGEDAVRLATIDIDGRPTGAVIRADGNAVVLGRTAGASGLADDAPAPSGSLAALIAGGPAALAAARRIADSATEAVPAGKVRLLAPLPRPGKNVFCVGRNYAEHIAEGERAQNVKIGVTEVPVFFTKPATAVIGPGAPVPIFPHVSTQIDYEVELAVVIGKAGRDIPRERAFEHVFGSSTSSVASLAGASVAGLPAVPPVAPAPPMTLPPAPPLPPRPAVDPPDPPVRTGSGPVPPLATGGVR